MLLRCAFGVVKTPGQHGRSGMSITIRISGAHAKAAAEEFTQKIGLPVGTPDGQDGPVKLTGDGKAEVILGVHATHFNAIVAPAVLPFIRTASKPDGIFIPEAIWGGGVLELTAV